MTALHLLDDLTPEDAAFFDSAADYAPRLVTSAPLAIPRPVGAEATILCEWSAPGATFYTRTEQAADSLDARNPAWWRSLLGPGSLRLTSHPAGMADPTGFKTFRRLGTWAADDEAPDATRYDAAARRATVGVGGVVASAVLTSCPDGVPHYAVADVSALARMVREARRNQNNTAKAENVGGVR